MPSRRTSTLTTTMTADPGALQAYMASCRARLDRVLDQVLPGTSHPAERLNQACHYAVTVGGKRLRPVLAYAACELAGATPERADTPAAAVELLHSYSLVHDDLPAMDDDDLRRGQPTCHRAYDEATAILAGDSLHTLAFQVLAEHGDHDSDQRLAMIQLLCGAVGTAGMAAGQMLDMEATGKQLSLSQLETLHSLKTGRLITASLLMGGLAGGADSGLQAALQAFGDATGLAFQIHDDILDVTGETAELGKPGGSDTRHGKNTFPALLGLEASQSRARALCEQACEALAPYGQRADRLVSLARFIIERKH